jgi:hypothetical protein
MTVATGQTDAAADGVTLTVRFEGFSRPLAVAAPDGGVVRLLPWTYAAHMTALRDSAVIVPEGLMLDRATFAGHVLRHSGLAAAAADWLMPVALWWAAGGDDAPAVAAPDGTVDLGSARALLRPWTEGERLGALGASLVRGGEAGDWLDGVGYLDAMVRRSLVALDPPATLDDLDSQAVARLLAAVTALNIPEPGRDPLLSGLLPQAAVAATLELCRALNWTPAQVLDTPAAEVQRLMALLRRSTGRAMPSAPAPPTGLAMHPDAAVFTFVEDTQ